MSFLLASCVSVLRQVRALDWHSFRLAMRPGLRSVTTTLLILGLVSTTGCTGCQSKEDKEKATQAKKLKEEQEKRKKLPDFESLTPVAMPGIVNDPIKMKRKKSRLRNDPVQKEIDALRSESLRKNYIKPGHWHDIRFQAIANQYDIEGELYAGAVPLDGSMSRFLQVEGTKYMPVTKRLAALPKGDWKTFDSSVFYPARDDSYATASIRVGLNRYGGGQTNFLNAGSLRTMAPDQHHLLVLTSRKDVFRYLELAPTIQLPGEMDFERNHPPSYIVIASDPSFPAPVPRHALNWTSIAYLIWDDFDPDLLDSDQQTAMVDWIHFGGQLILSGPDCVERLEDSFLGDYLPGRAEAAVNLSSDHLNELNASWSLPEKNATSKKRDLQVLDKSPLLGVNFQLHEDANFMEGSGELVAERQLGRGRIVTTSFSLAAPTVRAWRSFDSFLSNVLMRRLPRTFKRRDDLNNATYFSWQRDDAAMRDPLLHSSLRFLSRDLSTHGTSAQSRGSYLIAPADEAAEEGLGSEFAIYGNDYAEALPSLDGERDLDDLWHYGGFDVNPKLGVASWNDFNGVAAAARSTLQNAAGISPPSGNFVLQMLAGYLLVLVPINWLVFWLVGKVEYAWIAAPIIAVIGALVVIRMASLDIGFSRSNTQVALLEIPVGYDRGHLTEYSALYTSLSTAYRVELDNPTSQALPFPTQPRSMGGGNETPVTVNLDKVTANELSGLQIQSNTTELLHAEHMFGVGGRIRVEQNDDGETVLINNSTVKLKNVLIVGAVKRKPNAEPMASKVIQKTKSKKRQNKVRQIGYQFAVAKEIDPKTQLKIVFDDSNKILEQYRVNRLMFNARRTATQLWNDNLGEKADATTMESLAEWAMLKEKWDDFSNAILMRKQPNEDVSVVSKVVFLDVYEQTNPTPYVSLGKIFDCIFDNLKMNEGDMRLFGTTDQKIGQTKIYPDSTQTDRQTLVVAHLTYPRLPDVGRDTNSVADLKSISDLDRKKMELFND